MDLRTLVDEWFENVWNRKSKDHVRQLLAEDAVLHGLPLDSRTDPVEAFVQFQRSQLNTIPDMHIEVTRFIADGNEGIGFAAVSGTDAKSGKPVAFKFSFWVRSQDGRIAEVENIVDFLTYLGQSGVVEGDTLPNHLA